MMKYLGEKKAGLTPLEGEGKEREARDGGGERKRDPMLVNSSLEKTVRQAAME
jgi:hypothetical protein